MAKKSGKKRSGKRAAAGAAAGAAASAGGGDGLGGMSTAELQRELRRREGSVKKLISRRDKLREQLASLEAEIAAEGGVVVGGGKRHRNEMPLADALAGVLKGKVMGVTEVARAVQEAGYRTTSTTFRTIVNQTLLRDRRFKKVGRGQYTVE